MITFEQHLIKNRKKILKKEYKLYKYNIDREVKEEKNLYGKLYTFVSNKIEKEIDFSIDLFFRLEHNVKSQVNNYCTLNKIIKCIKNDMESLLYFKNEIKLYKEKIEKKLPLDSKYEYLMKPFEISFIHFGNNFTLENYYNTLEIYLDIKIRKLLDFKDIECSLNKIEQITIKGKKVKI